MKTRSTCLWALASLFCLKTASAQAGAYLLFTGANLDPVGTASTRIYGPTVGIYADLHTPLLKLGADVRAAFLNGSGTRNYYAVVGPRIAVQVPVLALKPYGEALIGGGDSTSTATQAAALHIDYELLAGVDRPLIPLISWRILEFSYTHNIYGAGDLRTKSLSTGIVFNIP